MIEIIVNKYVCCLIEHVRAMKVIFIAWTCFMNFCVSAQGLMLDSKDFFFLVKYNKSFAYDNEWALSG